MRQSGELVGKLNEDKQPGLVPSTIVSAKATDTLGSDTPGKDLLIILLYILGFIPQTTPTDVLYHLLKPSKQLQRLSIITVCIATASLWYAILFGEVWVQDRQNMLSHKRNKG